MSSPHKGEWLKPSDVFQRLKAKKRALKARINQGVRKQALETSHPTSVKNTSEKRTNPFRCSGNDFDTKRPRLEESIQESSVDQTLFEILRSGVGDVMTAGHAPAGSACASTTSASTTFAVVLPNTANSAPSQGIPLEKQEVNKDPAGVTNLPTDWGLKTKIRFLSKTPFLWTSRLKTLEEASAVTSCVRCLPTDQSSLDTSPNARLHRHALYWQHPWLPWLPLFPRLHSRAAGPRSLFTDSAMQDTLRTEWGESLRSLFQLLRSRQCPFFYVCAASFCCLFRAAGVGGITDAHAIITPTTRGLRDLLKRDDVQFSLPLRPSPARPPTTTVAAAAAAAESVSSVVTGPAPAVSASAPASAPASATASASASASTHAAASSSADEPLASSPTSTEAASQPEDVSEDEDEDAEHWLQRMGIQADAMPGMHSTRRKLQQESSMDGRPQSTVLVQGGDVYPLLNFLLNTRACVTASGPLAGVPPTLLAPVGFQGASLQPLKVRHGTVQQARQTFHSFELAGPVMPHAVAALVRLVRRTHADFTVSLSGVRGGEALSRLPPPGALSAPAVFGQQGLADCGLEAELVEALCEPVPDTAAGAVLREVTCRQGLFTW